MKPKSDLSLPVGLSVVIPVYRSAPILPQLAARLADVLPKCATDYEVILVCDGGQDDENWAAVCNCATQYPWLSGINLAKRCGQHAATLVGIRAARFDRIVSMDDDLQHPPEEIPTLLSHLGEKIDVVYGRPTDKMDGWMRNFSSRAIREVIRHLHGISHVQSITAFRVMRTELRDRFGNPDASFVFLDLVLAWVTERITSVPVRIDRRVSGKSSYSFIRRLSLALTLIATYSPHSLRMMFLLTVGWLVLSVGTVIFWISTNYFPLHGQAIGLQLQNVVLIAGMALQLLLLLTIGGLLAKIYITSIGVPQAIVQETVNLRR